MTDLPTLPLSPLVSLDILSGSQHGPSFMPSISFGFSLSSSMYPRIALWSSQSFSVHLYFLLGGVSLGIVSGSPLISPFSSLFTPFLPISPFSHLVSHFTLCLACLFRRPLSMLLFPIFSLLGPAWAYCPARPSSLPSSSCPFLSFPLPLLLPLPFCPPSSPSPL